MSQSLSRPDIRIKAGCADTLTFALGTSLVGCTVSWVASRDVSWRDPGVTVGGLSPDAGTLEAPDYSWCAPVLRKTATVSDAANGVGSVTLSGSDTAAFASERGLLLAWDLVVQAADLTLSCPLEGHLFVAPAVGGAVA